MKLNENINLSVLGTFLIAFIVAFAWTQVFSSDSVENSSPLSMESIETNSAHLESSYSPISDCEAGQGVIRESNELSPKILTFSGKIIGVRLGEGESIHFQRPPNEEECQKDSRDDMSENFPRMTYLEGDLKSHGFEITSNGSQICKPGLGKVWASEQYDTEIISFNEKIIGFRKSSNEPVFLKNPPEASECVEEKYLSDSEKYSISGTNALDLFARPVQEKTIQSRPDSCNEWYTGSVFDLDCDYTTDGLEEVSMIADPANYVQAPMDDEQTSYTVTTSLGNSWDLEFFPNGDPLITYKNGNLIRYKNGSVHLVGSINDVLDTQAAGLMGLAMDPDFEQNNYVYVYYTYEFDDREIKGYPKAIKSRISRFKLEDEQLQNEKVLLGEIPSHNQHAGGRLEFGLDGKLFATVGEGGAALNPPSESQNISKLQGKILRLNKNGSIPEDNPFDENFVYSSGHRNPQGLGWHPETGQLYASEHGPWRNDEINKIEAGGNYGWGGFKCDKVYKEEIERIGESISPKFCVENWSLAPSGSTFVDDPDHPWSNSFFVASLRGKHVHRFEISNGDVERNSIFYVPEDIPWNSRFGSGRVRDVEYHDDSLWVLGDHKWLARIEQP